MLSSALPRERSSLYSLHGGANVWNVGRIGFRFLYAQRRLWSERALTYAVSDRAFYCWALHRWYIIFERTFMFISHGNFPFYFYGLYRCTKGMTATRLGNRSWWVVPLRSRCGPLLRASCDCVSLVDRTSVRRLGRDRRALSWRRRGLSMPRDTRHANETTTGYKDSMFWCVPAPAPRRRPSIRTVQIQSGRFNASKKCLNIARVIVHHSSVSTHNALCIKTFMIQ